MNTIKIKLSLSGRVAALDKNFPLFQGQFANTLLNVSVPTAMLAADFEIQHYIGNYSSDKLYNDASLQDELNNFVLEHTSVYNEETETWVGREPIQGDVIFYTDTTNDKFYRAVYSGSNWGFTEVPYFAMGNFAGTSVKIGVLAVARNGVQYKSKSYYMRYVKTYTANDGIEYAMYERKMPREFTAYEGQGQNAPTVIINVVNSIAGVGVENIVTSQTCNFDVLPSTQLDEDEPIEPTAQEEIWGAINDIADDLNEKQDKKDAKLSIPASVQDPAQRTVVGAINDLESRKQDKTDNALDTTSKTIVGAINELEDKKQDKTDNALNTTNKTVVGAINEVKQTAEAADAQAGANAGEITSLKGKMDAVEGVADAANQRSIQNAQDIADIEAIIGTGEDFIGTLTVDHEVTNSELTAFVQTTEGRAPKGGDTVIVVQTIAGGTDKNFRYIYTGATWDGYEIPPVELASNGTAGLVNGTYGVKNYDTLVSIVGGEIQTIYIKVDGVYEDFRTVILGIIGSISNIVSGATPVGEAEVANKDSAGNNIALQFANILSGASKVGAAAAADAAEIATKDSAGNNIATQFADILSGTTQVGSAAYAAAALKATQDALGNNIVDTYLTKTAGATKQYVKDYAMPKEFNNTFYIVDDNGQAVFSENEPSITSPAVELKAIDAPIGETVLGEIAYTLGDVQFKLSNKNSFSGNYEIYRSATTDEQVYLKVNTYYQKSGAVRSLASVEIVPLHWGALLAYALANVTGSFSYLPVGGVEFTTGDKIIQEFVIIREASTPITYSLYSGSIFLSRFWLHTTAQTLIVRETALGELPYIYADNTRITVQSLAYVGGETVETVIVDINNSGIEDAIGQQRNIAIALKMDFSNVTITNREMARLLFRIGESGSYQYISVVSRLHSPAIMSDLVPASIEGTSAAEMIVVLQPKGAVDYPASVTMAGKMAFLDIANIESVKGTSGTITLLAANWSNNNYTLSLAQLGASNALFVTPSTTADQEAASNAGIFFDPNPQGITVTVTAETTPSTDISFEYFIARG